MKHLEKFDGYNERPKNIIPSESDFEEINKELLNKIKENGIEPNIDAIYSDLELLKKDKTNSFIFHIVKKYLIKNNYDASIQNIMRTSIKFFDNKYGDVIKQFKEDRKKEFNIDTKKDGNYVFLKDEDSGEMIKVPRKIGHNYIPLKIIPMEELHTKYSRHKRLKTFHVKGLKCVRCDRVGKYLIAAKDKGGAIHLDIYTKDFELMTVDHIKPKSRGGTYDIENLDPMCCFCNTKKAAKYEEDENNVETSED
jgi:hypothetical protein